MKIKDTFTVPVPLEKLAEVMVSEAYNLESEQAREGVVSTEYRVKEQGDARTVYEMHTTEYSRTKTGGLNKNDHTHTILTHTYTAATRTLTWVYGNAKGSSRLELSGVYTLTPQGDQTRLEHEVEINLRIPLIGGKISGYIAKQFQGTFPEHQALLKKHLNKQGLL